MRGICQVCESEPTGDRTFNIEHCSACGEVIWKAAYQLSTEKALLTVGSILDVAQENLENGFHLATSG